MIRESPVPNPKHENPIIILFSCLDQDKHFLAAYKEMPSKEEMENQCFAFFTDMEYIYLKYFGSVEQPGGYTYQTQQYFLK